MSELVVYHLAPAWDLPSASPFCLKLDAFLRMTGIPHRALVAATPFGGPKGKAPWIEHDGRKIGDSGFIIDYLKLAFGADPDAALTPTERGMAVAVRRLAEENLYWAMVHERWMVDANWVLFRDVVLAGVPAAVRPVVGVLARNGVRRQLKGHGIGLHSRDEILAIGRRDIGALADVLGDKPFFFGETPTETDAVVYSIVANIALAPIPTPLRDEANGQANLAAFLERFRARFYG